jgi:sulfoxide reductase heme-binding subunit YedZ
MTFPIWPQRIDKPILFVASLIPLGIILYDIWANQLGANPVEALSHRTGAWALRFLWFTLAITPLRKQFGLIRLVPLRRMLGLYAFFYASLHLFVYLVLDRSMLMSEIIGDISKRPYIIIGFTVFLMLVPLAATSNSRMIRRLGGQRWKRLHRLVYPAAIGANIHFFWLVKSDIREPLLYSVILAILLSYRLPAFFKKQPSPVPR